MQNWLHRQNKFTRWTAMGTATSAIIGMAAVAAIIITLIAALVVGQRTIFGEVVYPPVLDDVVEVSLYFIAVSILGFLISAAGLIVSLLVGNKTGQVS